MSLNLDDIIAKLTSLPEDERKEIESSALEATKHMAFIPLPGPQTEAYFSKADVLLFGGSPGGGKTALECGLALNEHHRALIIRKNFVDLAGVLHTLDNILGQENSAVGGNRPKYRKPGGGIIDFMGIGDDLGGKQGNPHDLICVGEGTPVLMGDGSYKPVEKVNKGDLVATLEGPRRVLNSFPTPPKEAICVTLPSGLSQIQSTTHKLLTNRGWISFWGGDVSPPYETCEPKGFRGVYKSFAQSCRRYLTSYLSPVRHVGGRMLKPLTEQVARSKASGDSSVCVFYKAPANQESDSAMSDGSILDFQQPVLSSWWLPVRQLLLRVSAFLLRIPPRCVSLCGVSGARKMSELQGCSDHYPCGSRFYGGHILESSGRCAAPKDAQSYPLLLVDAAQQNPKYSQAGETARIHIRSPRKWWYAHPYTSVPRQSSEAYSLSACSVAPVGKLPLFDLEIEEVNHFITLGGFVNKNCIDEAAQIPEEYVRMLIGWLRTDIPGQRCRVVLGSNPPLDTTGDWLITYFAPWLDPKHPRPAQEGELRYFLPNLDGYGDHECEVTDSVMFHGVRVTPQSRTFISSKFTDNPYYDEEQYAKSLAGLPDAARDALMSGSFMLERKDDIYQTIPTAWVRAAQERWKSVPPVGVPMCAIGTDVAQGGSDKTTLAIRHDGWYAPIISVPGKETPDGKSVSGHVVKHRRDNAKVIVDIGGGWGGDAYAHLRENGVDAVSYMGVKPSNGRTADKQLKFFNVRSEAYWRFREALDPSQPQGSPIMLPPDAELVADLCAPSYEVGANGIKVEAKIAVCDRLKRSTDKGDAVVMAWYDGLKQINVEGGWAGFKKHSAPKVVMKKNRR